MLTERQLALFKSLGEDPVNEKEIRQRHKVCVKDFGAVKDFTQWLVKRLHRQWELERRQAGAIYLGD
jgi:methyl coenzyme M reductase subunit C